MNRFKKFLGMIALSAASAAVWFGVSSLVDNRQFAMAQERVETSRQALANVQDMAVAFREVAKVVEPSVVKIDVRKTVKVSRRNPMMDPDLLRRFFEQQRDNDRDDDNSAEAAPETPDEEMLQMGEGSGVIMETDGSDAYILTNNHVAGGASDLRVTLSDGREITNVKIVGTDSKSDLALLKIPASNVIAAHWGDSNQLQKGDLIFAFGSPFGYVGSMTHGIVSALHRERVGIIGSEFAYENFIQVDAPINPGNSGGPLVNLKGEVVGINTAIATSTRSFAGIGFAIPSEQAKSVYQELREKGKVVRAWLGVSIVDVAQQKEMASNLGFTGAAGVIVGGTMKDAPSTGVLRSGDIINAINGTEVKTGTELRNMIAKLPPDSDAKLTIFRDGKSQEVTVKLGEQPEDLLSVAGSSSARNGRGEPETSTLSKLGITLVTPNDAIAKRYGLSTGKGALVSAVQPGSVANQLGLQSGDLITRVGDKQVAGSKEAIAALADSDLTKGVRLYVTNKSGERLVFVRTK